MTWRCDLWPSTAPLEASCTADTVVPREAIFPSARQAIAQGLADAGYGAASLIGYPRFVSSCVPRAINKVATPIRFSGMDVDDHARLDGLLVHEQWGWPLPNDALGRLFSCFSDHADRFLVIDRVDSADYFHRTIGRQGVLEVVSLSKTLGLIGGGLARHSSSYSAFNSKALSASTRHALDRLAAGGKSEPYREFFKDNDQVIHPAVSAWVSAHSVSASMQLERTRRQQNVRLVQSTPLADRWPWWMHEALDHGAGPGLVPVLRGRGPDQWSTAMRLLGEGFGVASTVALFNWSGDPLAPDYEACMLIPVHGEMRQLPDLVGALTPLELR